MARIKNKQVVVTSDWAFSTNRITGLGTPQADYDAATKLYVDSIATGLDPKESCLVATSGDTGSYSGSGSSGGTLSSVPASVDGITLEDGDRILVKDQSDAKENGIYVKSGSTWNRAPDQDGNPEAEVSAGNFTFIETGATYIGYGFVVQGDGVLTINTDPIVWVKFSKSDLDAVSSEITSLSSAINSEISTTDSEVTSLSSAINSEVTSLSSVLSTEISTTGSEVTSLSSALSSEISTTGSEVTSLSAAVNASTTGVTSLSTALSSEISTTGSEVTSLSSALSSEISITDSEITSLSTAIITTNTLSGLTDTDINTLVDGQVLIYSGGTDKWINQDPIEALDIFYTSAQTQSLVDSLSTALSTEVSTTGSEVTSLSTALSSEISTTDSEVTSLSTAIEDVTQPEFFVEIKSPNSAGGTGAAVYVDDFFNTGFTGEVDEQGVFVFLNGVQYPFNYTNNSNIIFHTSGNIPGGTGAVSLYFDEAEASFTLDTDDDVTLKYFVRLD